MQVYTLRSSNGTYIFFEENSEKGIVFYSLCNQAGETLLKGQMNISMQKFVYCMQVIGFDEYIPKGDLF